MIKLGLRFFQNFFFIMIAHIIFPFTAYAESPFPKAVPPVTDKTGRLEFEIVPFVQEFEPDTVRSTFTVRNLSNDVISLVWDVDLSYEGSVQVNDFIKNSFMKNTMTIQPKGSDFVDVYFQEDEVKESIEYVSFLFRYADTNQPVLTSDGGSMRLTTNVIDPVQFD